MPDITTLFEGTDGVSRTLFNQKLSDINAHGNDATMHVTAAERSVWSGKANGNNAVWIATSVNMSDNDLTYILTVPNFAFTEGCQVTFLAPVAPTASPWTNIWVGQRVYRIRTLSHENLSGDEWTANTNVAVTLSSQVIPNGADNAYTAFFKGGSGSIKEMYDFPLSIQTAEPTPVNTNHVWIQNNTKLSLTIDEAIRASDWNGDNRYYGILDNTDNMYLHADVPKSTTDGSMVGFVTRHVSKDTTPWSLAQGIKFASKHGIGYWSGGASKWPRIMSRINGTIDVENAKRWDGSAWQWLSQKGHYVMDCTGVMSRTESTLSNYRTFSSKTPATCVDVTLDGIHIARTISDTLEIIKREGDNFSVISTFTTSDDTYYYVCRFSPDGQYLAVNTRLSNGVRTYGTVIIYKKNTSGVWSQLTTIAPAHIRTSVCWNEDGTKLAILAASYDSDDGWGNAVVYFYSRSGDTFSLLKYVPAGTSYSNASTHGLFMQGDVVIVNGNVSQTSSLQSVRRISYSAGNSVILNSAGSTGYGIQGATSLVYLNNNVFAYAYRSSSSSSYLCLINVSSGVVKSFNFSTLSAFTVSPDKKYLFLYAYSSISIYSIDNVTPNLTLISSTSTTNLNRGELACW